MLSGSFPFGTLASHLGLGCAGLGAGLKAGGGVEAGAGPAIRGERLKLTVLRSSRGTKAHNLYLWPSCGFRHQARFYGETSG